MTNEKKKFWRMTEKKVFVSLSDIIDFLAAKDFGTYHNDLDPLVIDPIIIQVKDKIAIRHTKTGLVKFCLDYLNTFDVSDQTKREIRSVAMEKFQNLKTSDFFNLPIVKPSFVKDSRNKAYLFFRNGFVKIRGDYGKKPKLFGYHELPGVIWETQVIQRNFHLFDRGEHPYRESILLRESLVYSYLSELVQNTSSYKSDYTFDLLRMTLGYLVHDYNYTDSPRAIAFADSKPKGAANHGDGITILIRFLAELKKIRILDIKDFSTVSYLIPDNREITSELFIFEGVDKYFDLHHLDRLSPSGIINGPNTLPGPSSRLRPKIILLGEHNLWEDASKYIGKIIGFDFAHSITKKQEFRAIFNDLDMDLWTENKWDQFYNFMIGSIDNYLTHAFQKSNNDDNSAYVSDSLVTDDPF